jgi:hypothetical protein
MFMPQAQPHLARSHGAPGTARRARVGDKENAGALPSKTPSRAPLGKAGPSGRALGARTVDRNVQTQKPSEDIAPKRLFQDDKKSQKAPLRLKTPGPRGMKTPGPRHMRTPAPLIYHDEPTPAPLPSAQRTRRRNRSSLQSPPHEDPDMSLDSILEVAIEPLEEVAAEDDYELEYAPLTAVDRPYEPDWAESMPDMVETMAALAQIRPMSLRTPPSPPRDNFEPIDVPTITLCPDTHLDHPLLQHKKMASQQPKAKEPPARAPLRAAGAGVGKTASRSAAAATTSRSAPRPATTSGVRPTVNRPTTSSMARTAATAPKRPASTTAAAPTTRAPARGPSAGPVRAASSAAPRTASANTTRSAASQASATRPVRPATASSVRAAPRTGLNGTRPATATPTSRLTRLPPRIGKVSKAVRPESPGPVMPAGGDDMLDLDLGELDEKNDEKVAEKVETAPKEPKPEQPTGASSDAAKPEAKPEPVAHLSASPRVAVSEPVSPSTLSPATLHPLQITPTSPMSPLMSPRLPTSPLRDEVFDFAALTAALPPPATTTPEEHIEMSPLAEPADLVPTPPGGQPDRLVITFTNRRLARISERTEVDSSFDDSFRTSFDGSFDADDNTN